MGLRNRMVASVTHDRRLNEDLGLEQRNKHMRTAKDAVIGAAGAAAGVSVAGVGVSLLPAVAAGVTMGTIIHSGRDWWHRKHTKLHPEEISAILKYIDHIIREEPLDPEMPWSKTELAKIRNAVLTILGSDEHKLTGADLPIWMQKLLTGEWAGADYLAIHAEDRKVKKVNAAPTPPLSSSSPPLSPPPPPPDSSGDITRQGLRWGGGKKSLRKRKSSKKKRNSKRRKSSKKKKYSKKKKSLKRRNKSLRGGGKNKEICFKWDL